MGYVGQGLKPPVVILSTCPVAIVRHQFKLGSNTAYFFSCALIFHISNWSRAD